MYTDIQTVKNCSYLQDYIVQLFNIFKAGFNMPFSSAVQSCAVTMHGGYYSNMYCKLHL